ncbi:peptidoglycan-binding domain-containing protein [Rhizobium leguminosarum]|uniref:peptidoglycan-binding domain-containing protein n=1 Tax=Rhizobium leguminosarum TaxID=384 RepID=UPI003CFF15A8
MRRLLASGATGRESCQCTDEDTRAALSQMQKDNNLKITGTVTTEVLNAFGIAAQ